MKVDILFTHIGNKMQTESSKVLENEINKAETDV